MKTRVAVFASNLCAFVLLAGAGNLHAQATVGVLSGTESCIVCKPGDQFDPAISGQYVVFTDTSGGDADVWYYDGTTATLHAAVTGPGDQLLTDVAGSRLVYTDNNTGNGDIRLYDIITEGNTAITSDPYSQSNPTVSGRLVACGGPPRGRSGHLDP